MGKFYISKTNKIGYVNPFADEATPGFELGNKGFAVPRLTARPCRQNDTKYMKPPQTQKRGFFHLFFFFLLKKEKVYFQPQNKKVRINWNP